jgi:hypothetical protein
LQALGAYLGIGRNQYEWTREQREAVYRSIHSGERQFYLPVGHSWSFLRPIASLTVDSGDSSITLPDDFGGFVTPGLSFTASDNQYFRVRLTSVENLLSMQQLSNVLTGPQPEWAAVSMTTFAGTTGQRYELLLFPTPTADGTLKAPYYSIPNATSDSLPYPLGGQPHAETLLESCLAAAELEKTGQAGPHRALFQERLMASIQHDKRMGPKNLGYNADRSSGDGYQTRHTGYGETLTYNGDPLD